MGNFSIIKKLGNSRREKLFYLIILFGGFGIVAFCFWNFYPKRESSTQRGSDSGDRMLALIERQLEYGPRYLSAEGHSKVVKFITTQMETSAGETINQTWQYQGSDGKEYELTNIIGKFNPTNKKRIILATHYDSKKFADKDLLNRDQPVPGANDSASGVAVLLELAQILKNSNSNLNIGVDMVFFDGEEGEENQGGDYVNWIPLGSTYFAEHLDDIYGAERPIGAVVIDMVCDKDLKIPIEQSSIKNAPQEVKLFWDLAKKVNKEVFIDRGGLEIKDDHTPLNQAGIPSFLVIDFDYPSFHTTRDTADKCSARSLEVVSEAVVNYLDALEGESLDK